jgi:hypothetical protein
MIILSKDRVFQLSLEILKVKENRQFTVGRRRPYCPLLPTVRFHVLYDYK